MPCRPCLLKVTLLQIIALQNQAAAQALHLTSGMSEHAAFWLVPLTAVFYTCVGGIKVRGTEDSCYISGVVSSI